MIDYIEFIDKKRAELFIKKYHYSKVMPRITYHYLGGFSDDNLMAVMTLGYGVRPIHTIKKLFPSLDAKDYLEIGKLCVADEMPKNTESNFISQSIKLLKSSKKFKDLKLLYSWADGIIGKPGYVYQASNFYYGGFIWTEMYLDKNGVRIHPRTMQGLSTGERSGNNKFKSRSYETAQQMGLTKYFGKQFRYLFPLCGKRKWNKIRKKSIVEWTRNNYPKDKDCEWLKQIDKGKRVKCKMPDFQMTNYIYKDKTINHEFWN